VSISSGVPSVATSIDRQPPTTRPVARPRTIGSTAGEPMTAPWPDSISIARSEASSKPPLLEIAVAVASFRAARFERGGLAAPCARSQATIGP
jgi:hypothetical protein